MRLGDQHATVCSGHDGLAATAAARDLDAAQTDQIDHGQRGAGFALGRVAGDEQQAVEPGSDLAKGDRIDLGVQAHPHSGATALVERHHIAARRPGSAPQRAIGRERQVVDAHVAEMAPAGADRVEGLDTVTGRDVDFAAVGLDRQRLRDAGAKARHDLAAISVQAQQCTAAGGGPQLAVVVHGEVEDRLVEFDERGQRAPAVVRDAVQPAAVRAAAGDDRTIGKFEYRQRADAGVAVDEVGRVGLAGKGPLDQRELGQLGQRRRRRDLLLGYQEQGVGRRCRGWLRRRQILRRIAKAGQIAQVGAGAVILRLDAAGRLLAVAGAVGCERQELVAMPGLTSVDAEVFGRLAQPDLEVAAVFGHVDGGVGHARAAVFVDRFPAHLVVGRSRRDARGSQRRHRRSGVQGLRERARLLRRDRIEAHHGAGADLGARRQIGLGLHAVAELTDAAAVAGIGQQQAARRILQHLAGVGIDRLQDPGRGVRARVYAGRDAQHEALGIAQVEVALEQRASGRDVDRHVAQLDVAQSERGRVERRIEFAHDANLGHRGRCRGRVLELHRIGQRLADRQELVHTVALRSGDGSELAVADGLLVKAREVQRRECVRSRNRGVVGQRDRRRGRPILAEAHKGHEDVERLKIGRVRQVEVVVLEQRQRRHRNIPFEAVAFAMLVVVDRRLGGRRVAVPLLDLGEELGQIAGGAQLIADRPEQNAGGKRTHQAHDLDVLANRRRLVNRSDDPDLLQRAQIGADPGLRVGSQIAQRDRRALLGQRRVVPAGGGDPGVQINVTQDRGAQPERRDRLVGDEFVARHRGGGADDIEAIRNERDHALVR